MTEWFRRIIRTLLFGLLTVVGFIFALTLIISALLAAGILYLVGLVRGKPFSGRSFMRRSTEKARRSSQQFNQRFCPGGDPRVRRSDPTNITDVELK